MVNNDITIIGVHHLCLFCRCLVAPRVTPLLTLRNSYRLKQDVNRYDSFPFSFAYEDTFSKELCAPYRPSSKKVLEPHRIIYYEPWTDCFACPFVLFVVKEIRGLWKTWKLQIKHFNLLFFCFPY